MMGAISKSMRFRILKRDGFRCRYCGKAASRQLIGLADEMTSRCYRGEERPAEILERVESQIFQIASREIKGGFVYFGDIVNARDIRVRQLPGDPHFGEEALAAHGIFGELGR